MIFRKIKQGVNNDLEAHLGKVAEDMAKSMRHRLIARGHYDTFNLIHSIKSSKERTQNEISAYVTIDAHSNEGVWYAEFLEYGSGIYREGGGGRQTPWRYKDREGEWHTTQGQEPDPFIRPAIAENIGKLEQGVKEITGNLKRYAK